MFKIDPDLESHFRTTQDGRELFFPWIPFGTGYVVPSADHKKRICAEIRRRTSRRLRTALALVVVLLVPEFLAAQGVLLPSFEAFERNAMFLPLVVFGAVAIPLLLLWSHLDTRSVLEKLEPTNEKLALRQYYEQLAAFGNPRTKILGLAVWVVLVIVCLAGFINLLHLEAATFPQGGVTLPGFVLGIFLAIALLHYTALLWMVFRRWWQNDAAQGGSRR